MGNEFHFRSKRRCAFQKLRGEFCVMHYFFESRACIAYTVLLMLLSVGDIDAMQLAVSPAEFRTKRVSSYDGVTDGLPFRAIASGVLIQEGEFAILDRDAPALVRVRRGKGTMLGRVGSGPGEYRTPSSISLSGDSLAIIETLSRRLTLFPMASNAIGRTRNIPPLAGGAFSNAGPVLVTPNGTFTQRSNPDGDSRRTGRTNDTEFLWTDRLSGRTTLLVSLSRPGLGLSVPVLIDGEKFTSATFQPFVSTPLWSASKNSAGLAVVEFSQPGPGGKVDVRLRQWNNAGALARTCNWSENAERLTSAAYSRGAARLFPSERVVAKADDIAREVTRPAYLPIATALQFASDGSLWLRSSVQFLKDSDAYVRIGASDCADRARVQFDALVAVLDARGSSVLLSALASEEPAAQIYRILR